MEKNPNPGSMMNIPEHISESSEQFFGLKILHSLIWIQMEKIGPATPVKIVNTSIQVQGAN
jgi:hypothetical protein